MKCFNCTLGVLNNGNKVDGYGNPNASIMIVGEAPGYREQRLSIPFIGKSGTFLKYALSEANYNLRDIYFTNVVKCRPPENRVPLEFEVSRCKSHLFTELLTIKPKYIICLGVVSATVFNKDFTTMSKAISKHLNINGTIVYFNYHPSYILRNPEMANDYINSLLILKQKMNHGK